jgi:hypothetical protein
LLTDPTAGGFVVVTRIPDSMLAIAGIGEVSNCTPLMMVPIAGVTM